MTGTQLCCLKDTTNVAEFISVFVFELDNGGNIPTLARTF